MEGFKKLVKMKTGGSVSKAVAKCSGGSMKKGGEVDAADIKQDKAVVKKAFAMHDKQEHGGEKTDLSKLKRGGRAKKEAGTVRKFKTGGSVTNVYEAKKSSGDKDNIRKTKDIVPGKAAAPSKASVKSKDVGAKTVGASGHKDPYIKSKESGKKAAAPSGAKETPNKYKCGGKVKKMADGRLTAALTGGALGGGLAGMVQDQERKKRIAKYLGPAQQAQLAAQQAQATAAQPPNAAAQMAAPPQDVMGSPTGMPAQKRGGKVKGKC
jgi:hypothetical protein